MSDDPIALAAAGQLVCLRKFPGHAVSSDGRVWSCWQRAGRPTPWVLARINPGPWSVMKLNANNLKGPNGEPYYGVSLKAGDGTRVRQLVHRLVLEAFVGACPPGQQCRHLDGDRSNNRLENLCWGTKLEDAADRIGHGTDPQGERNPRAKLTEKDVVEIFALRRDGVLLKEIARRKGVSMILVQKILARRLWPHVSI